MPIKHDSFLLSKKIPQLANSEQKVVSVQSFGPAIPVQIKLSCRRHTVLARVKNKI